MVPELQPKRGKATPQRRPWQALQPKARMMQQLLTWSQHSPPRWRPLLRLRRRTSLQCRNQTKQRPRCR